MLQLRPECSQDRRAEQDAGYKLSQDGRLTDTLHCLAEQSAAEQQSNDLPEEHREGGTLSAIAGGEYRSGRKPKHTSND